MKKKIYFLFFLLIIFELYPSLVISNEYLGREYFPNYKLITHEGKELRFFDDIIKDKIVLINFIYTNCNNSCSLETARLKRVQNILIKKMGTEIHFYSISIDPDNDSVEVLKKYHDKFSLDKNWFFLTGNKIDVEKIQRKFGLSSGALKNKDNIEDHSLSVIIGNQKTGQWIRRSHLEDPMILSNLLLSLNPKRKNSMNKGYEQAPSKMVIPSRGEVLFSTRCIDCHTIGSKDGLGPDLNNVTKRRELTWLKKWIKNPHKMIVEKDPIALDLYHKFDELEMPNLKLTDSEIEDVIKFIEIESSENQMKKKSRSLYEKK